MDVALGLPKAIIRKALRVALGLQEYDFCTTTVLLLYYYCTTAVAVK